MEFRHERQAQSFETHSGRKCEAPCNASARLDVVHNVLGVFGKYLGFGITAIAHLIIIAAIVITVSTFEVAKRKPDSFVRK